MGTAVAIRSDLRAAFGPARNQGERPTCLVFALSDAHSAARGARDVLSAEHLYYHAVKRTAGGHPGKGVALPEACEALKVDGQSLESSWPYLAKLPSDLAHWAPPATAVRLFRRGTQLTNATIPEIIGRLTAGQPVVVIFLMGARFYVPADGLVESGPNDADIAYHAVVAVGHGRSAADEDCLLIRNSWGEDWALEGYAWIAASYLEPRLTGTLVMEPG
jgi:hypothetical protein